MSFWDDIFGKDNPRRPRQHPQSILFERAKWTPSEARDWLRKEGYRAGKVDTGPKYHRFRQRSPKAFRPSTFRIVVFGRGIRAVMGHLR